MDLFNGIKTAGIEVLDMKPDVVKDVLSMLDMTGKVGRSLHSLFANSR
jgi:hypothetical protein